MIPTRGLRTTFGSRLYEASVPDEDASAYYQRVRAFLERYDYVLTPTAGVTAFRIDRPLPQDSGDLGGDVVTPGFTLT